MNTMDILDDIFTTLGLKGALYFRTDFCAPWGVTVPHHEGVARFHLVIQGRCFVRVNDSTCIELHAGDLIMIPRGMQHELLDSPDASAPPLEEVLHETGYTGAGVLTVGEGDSRATTQMVCGHLSFRKQADHPILQILPSYLLMANSCRAKHPLLDNIMRLITQRIFDDQLGAAASITRLSEIVFIELLKAGISETPQLLSLLEGFNDPKIGKSLQLIHEQLDNSWTVESLATEVAMSRSRFAYRFNELIGVGPMAYLSDWRLQKAGALLEQSRMSVQQIASRTGYQSASSFTRAFTGKFGMAPREFRQIA
ncbi:AraC family transcriptional regulator [Neptunomonas sp.]|uniref:AraC family transcriptional regulator n=1 Tax=Neptunomonas sp. TaxID=1971898 RepID=UPI0025E3FA36|nr:AraC family transcriptional regulator [Neptunomonas sp.]